ncbi:hypothetical protein N9B34_01370 [Akkermansiaceae bacterium]|nr:hypothetical protein [Akkermansiaceae bacterium]MDA7930873.1 hypothetical protein [Akkermansiaceae bacterium]MDB4520486.1 hypothetical protein [Akkermansiaceae bacterium]
MKETIISHTQGEFFDLRHSTGEILWRNPLTGLGYANCIIASNDPNTNVVIAEQQQNARGEGTGAH